MFQIIRYIYPGYLSRNLNREIQELYWAKGISDFAQAAVMLFEPIFLYSVLGFNLSEVLWFYFAVYAIYVVLIPFGAKVAAWKGYEHAILYASFFMVLYWALLFASQELSVWFFLAPVALAIQKSLYWPAFHADMARFSNAEQRGRENSGMFAMVSIIFILGPLVGGYILENFNYSVLFVLVTSLTLLSNVPLFTTPEKFAPKAYRFKDTWELYKNYTNQAIGYWGFGEELVQMVIWPIFIFITIPDFLKFGSIVSVSTLVATLVMLYVGVLTDQRSKRVLIRTFAMFNGLFWFLRPFMPSLPGIITTNTLGTISKHSMIVPITSFAYDQANETHILPYAVFYEQSLVIGKLLMMIAALIILQFTVSFTPLLIAAGIFSLLFAYLK